MTPRERLLTLLKGGVPDHVPVCPDISNMVPARLTGKPFWDIYVYKDPPLWKAYIDAVKHFGIDGGFELYEFGDLFGDLEEIWESRIVHRYENGSFVTQDFCETTGQWSKTVVVHTVDNPPATDVTPKRIHLPSTPSSWEQIKGVKKWPSGFELWKLIKKEMGERGVIGMPSGATTCLLSSPEEIYDYYDNPEKYRRKRDKIIKKLEKRIEVIAGLDEKPDFLLCGASGSLIFQTPKIFRELALPILKRVTELASEIGIPTHVHSCGPEKEMVKIAALETKLNVIDPLEIPPMGDCNLAELKNYMVIKLSLKAIYIRRMLC